MIIAKRRQAIDSQIGASRSNTKESTPILPAAAISLRPLK